MHHHAILVCTALLSLAGAGRWSVAAEPAVQHVVLFKFNDGTSPDAIRDIVEAFERLPGQIPGVTGLQWGKDNSPEGLQKGFTHAFVVTFKDPASRDAYLPHPAHQAFLELLAPSLDEAFAFDIQVDEAPAPAEPGRVHHLVFFKFKEDTPAESIQEVERAFAQLPLEIPGLMRYQAGTNTFPETEISRGFTHGFLLTFIHQDARDDYLPHPSHARFGQLVGPLLDDVLVVDFTVRPSGRTLLVTGGLEPFRVVQRDADGTASLEFSGLTAGDGPIEARILSGRRVVTGFDWKLVGAAENSTFTARLTGVPAGGEYTIEIRRRDALGNVADSTDVANILVGDVWILAGQSNMQGVGDLVDVTPPHPLVHAFTMAHRWEQAREPLHWLIDSRDPVHYRDQLQGLDEAGRLGKRAAMRKQRRKGAGLGLPFAVEMVRATGVPVGLIAGAHGGTSMSQWDPALRDRGGDSLYGSLLKQVQRAGGKVRGILWYQGESDAGANASTLFAGRFRDLIAAFRADLGQPELPFYYVQIGRFVIEGRSADDWKIVQESQRRLARETPGAEVVSVIDLPLDDLIHVSTDGLKRAGSRLARIARKRLFGESSLEIGPRLEAATLGEGGIALRVKFSDVNGRLHPADRVAGFSVRTGEGAELPLIFRASVDRESPDTVVLQLRSRLPENAKLWYGAGLDPYCNLVDSEDMAALAFGPVEIQR